MLSDSLMDEYAEICSNFSARYEALGDLKPNFEQLYNKSMMFDNKLIDLFNGYVFYPEISEDLNFIMFSELSNSCVKKLIEEIFELKRDNDDDDDILKKCNVKYIKLYGKSKNNVEIKYKIFENKKPKLVWDDDGVKEVIKIYTDEEILGNKTILQIFNIPIMRLKIQLPKGYIC